MTMQRATLLQAFGGTDITTQEMQTAITDWFNLYYNQTRTDTSDPCQRIAYTIVRKLTKATFAEYKVSSKDSFVQMILDNLFPNRKKLTQQELIGGSVLIKPVPMGKTFLFMPVPRKNIFVFGRNAYGEITDMGSWEFSTYGNQYYTLLERRSVSQDGHLAIHNSLYKSADSGNLGVRVKLNSIPRYEMLTDELILNIGSIGMVELRTPIENCVDGSHDAVSVYAAAAGLIHNIDGNEAEMNGEFRKGKSRIIASADMLSTDKNGRPQQLEDDVFVGLDEDPSDLGIHIFSPALRDQSFLARKQEYLRNCESIIGLKRGLLADVQETERTATEIASSDGDFSTTVIDFQDSWEEAVRKTVRLCGELGTIYNVPGSHKFGDNIDITFDWGNGVLYDPEADFAEGLDLVARGMLKPEIVLAKRYDMPYDTEADLAAVRAKYMPGLEGLIDEN